jgi:Flp pilus assembly protein TadD
LEPSGTDPQSTVVAQSSESGPDETRSPALHVARPLRRARVEPAAGAAQSAPSTAALASGAGELNRRANQQLLRGHLPSALDLFQRATERDPRSEAAYRGLGVVNERIGRRAAAIQAFRRALELEPHGPHVAALRTRLERLEAIR